MCWEAAITRLAVTMFGCPYSHWVQSGPEPFASYLETLAKCTNESQKRHAFQTLAATAYADSDLATDLTLGAEYQVSFDKNGLVRRGAADTFFGNLVIEFEFELRKTREHALDQLRGYVAGLWREEGYEREYLAVVTDGLNWEVYSPRKDGGGPEPSAENVELDPVDSLPASDVSVERLADFLNRLFFRKYLIFPNATNIARDFGLGSPVYMAVRRELLGKLVELVDDPQVGVLFDAWKNSLEVCYGQIEPDQELFVRHTYLANFARLLVWASLERRPIGAVELTSVLTGQYFKGRGISNLVEEDYFRWHVIPSPTDAGRTWVGVSHHLAGYDLGAVKEDILKPLYEDLVDPATRHDLGEFYTPDWLADRATERLLETWAWDSGEIPAVLDPTCGSGTFLRTSIHYVRERSSATGKALLEGLLSKVVGIDVHPLAVIVSRATYLLAIRELLVDGSQPITLPVFLANTLQMPEMNKQPSLFGDTVTLAVGKDGYPVPADFLRLGVEYDRTIDDVNDVARTYGKATARLSDVGASLRARIGSRFEGYSRAGELVEALISLTTRIAELARQRLDSIYGFMLKNHYRPAMLRESFDFVIGNPPWLTVSDISTTDYKNLVTGLGTEMRIAPRQAGEQSHTELATIFFGYVAREFLRHWDHEDRARVALVMPRSVFTATHHRLFRQGMYNVAFDVDEIWDLLGVSPLFNVPACVLFAKRVAASPSRTKKGAVFSGLLSAKDIPWATASLQVSIEDVEFELVFLGKRSAWRRRGETAEEADSLPLAASLAHMRKNAYIRDFRQGAILYPQSLMMVQPDHWPRSRSGVVHVVTELAALRSAKLLVDVRLDRVVDAANLFMTLPADQVLPYGLAPPMWGVILPLAGSPGSGHFDPVDNEELRRLGRLDTADWLDWAEEKWRGVRKQGETTPLWRRLDHMGHLSAQATMSNYVVLYTSAGSRPVAGYLAIKDLAAPFVVRDMTYWTSVSTEFEAAYLVAFLNSDFSADAIRDWMTVGLFGPRHIHKRVLDVPWPRYDPREPDHQELANAGIRLASEAKALLSKPLDAGPSRRRGFVRDKLSSFDRALVEKLVAQISAD